MTIPDDEAVSTAIDQGVPLVTGANQKRPVGIAVNKLTDYILREISAGKSATDKKAVKAERSSGFWGRFFGRRVRAGG
jgi:hypothetical protein